jgi:hypothetical protein
MNSTPNLQPLIHFRSEIYSAFSKAKDSLMNTADALMTETQAQSLPELSLSPHFQRQWPSLYEAFQDGKIDTNQLRRTFAKAAPLPQEGRVVLATDASSIARPKSITARDRTLVHESNLPEGCPPVVPTPTTWVPGNSPLWLYCPHLPAVGPAVGPIHWITVASRARRKQLQSLQNNYDNPYNFYQIVLVFVPY